MTFVRPRARILEISTTAGGGPLALAGAADGSYNSFASFMSVGDQTYVTVIEPGVAFWSGIATYSAANQITLTTVEETKGSFGAGTKEVVASPLASTSMFREDIAGAIVTGGTSTAYTATSHRKYNTLTELDGNIIAFTPHATNGQGSPSVTLNVDGLGDKTLRADPTRDLFPGVLVAGTPVTAVYNATAGVFYLHGYFGNPYSMPLGASVDFWGTAAPNSSLALAYGQAISRSAYSDLFAILGTTYGAGDGSTTFNIPDVRGRVVAGKDNMGGSPSGRLGSVVTDSGTIIGANLGSTGGSPTHALTINEAPAHSHGVSDPGHAHTNGAASTQNSFGGTNSGSQISWSGNPTNTSGTTTGISIQSNGGGAAHAILQPTIIANKLIRII